MPRTGALRNAIAVASCLALALVAPAPAQTATCGTARPGYARLVLAGADVRAYYRLDELAGTVACDLAGAADGTYRGDYLLGRPGALAGDDDPAVRFSGAGTVRVPTNAALSPGAALSVEAWVQPAGFTRSETILRKDGAYMLRLVDGRVVFRLWTSTGVHELVSPPVMRTVYPQQLVAVFGGGRMRLYRNGNQIASQAVSGTLGVTGEDLFLGSSFGMYDHYAGDLDEVAIHGHALSRGVVWEHWVAARPTPESFVGCGFGGFGAGAWPSGCWRPFTATSPFNRRVPSSPPVAADSEAVVRRLLGFGALKHLEAGHADTADDFGHPTYYSGPGDPVFRLHCYEESWGRCEIEGHEIHVPDAARPAAGADGHLAVVDQVSGWEYDLYKVRSKPAGGGVLEFRWGGRTRIDGDGLGSEATAAGFANLAGVVRAAELAAGRIDHALFVTVHCDAGRAVFPARKSGRSCALLGESTDDAPPMGAHLWLAMSPDEIAALPVPEWKKTVLRAMAQYGMFVGDTGGGSWGLKLQSGSTYTSFGFADELVGFARENGWTPYGDVWVGNLRDGVDWARRLRVLDPCVSRGGC